jgi:hypothetical protein
MKKTLLILTALLVLFLVPSAVYSLVNHADIIDEHYDLTAMDDLTVRDKLSVRVECPSDNMAQLQKFVAHYSICPHVLEIGVVASAGCQSLEGVAFQYLKVSEGVAE